MMRPRRGEADFEHVVGAAPSVKHRAAAAVAMRVDKLGDRRLDAGLAQRLDDEAALPCAVGSGRPMLQRAAAADAEIEEIGAMRSGLGFSTARSWRRSGWPGQSSTSTRSPGSVHGT